MADIRNVIYGLSFGNNLESRDLADQSAALTQSDVDCDESFWFSRRVVVGRHSALVVVVVTTGAACRAVLGPHQLTRKLI